MSTATSQPAPAPAAPSAPLPLLRSAAHTMFVGLLWGGLLLLILAWWLGLKFGEERSHAMPWLVAVAGIAAIALAAWHAFVLWFQKVTPEQQALALTNQRRLTGFALLGGGVALVVIAFLLGFTPRAGGSGGWPALKAMFGEAVGLFLFALVTIAAGRALLSPPREALATVNLEPIRGLFPLIRATLFILGAIALGSFLILAFYQRVGMGYFPELAGLLLFSMLCLAMGLWLMSTPSPDPFATRVFVLVFGGATGLILFLMMVTRTVAWSDSFRGGDFLEGEDSWKIWLCAYLQLIALGLVFVSLLLARADIRSNAILRRVLFGYNAVLNALFLLQILLFVNLIVAKAAPYRFDWTSSRGLHALAQSSKNLLHQLKRPTHIYVLLSSGLSSQTDVRSLLDNLQAESNKLDVTYVAPDRDVVMYDELRKKFPKILPAGGPVMRMNEDSGRGLLIVYGDLPKAEDHKVPYAFIPERKIYDEQFGGMPGQKPSKTFKGEVEVMKEINYLVGGGERRKLYFLQGDDEINIFETQAAQRVDPRGELSLLGASTLVDKLKKDNYDVEALTFSKAFADDPKRKTDKVRYAGPAGKELIAHIPNDAYAVVIAGASSPIPPEGITAVEKYAERGGKLLVLLDVVLTKALKLDDLKMRESGIEEMLKKFGVGSTDEFAITQMLGGQRLVDPFKVPALPPAKSEHVIAKQFADRAMWFKWVRIIRPSAAPGGRYKAEPVFASVPWQLGAPIPATMAERSISALRNPFEAFAEAQDRGELPRRAQEELPLVVAISEDVKPRMVVFGDTEFISNYSIMADRSDNYALFVSCLEWMAEHEGLIGPQPKESQTVSMPPTIAMQYTRIHLVPLWLMFLTIIGLGGGIWLVRRR